MTAFVDELRRRVERIRADHDQARQKAAEARATEEALAKELAAYEQIFSAELRRAGKAAPTQPALVADIRSANGKKKNKTGIALSFIAAAEGRGMNADELREAFAQHGQNINRNYVFNIVSRLKQHGKISVRGGRYYTRTDQP